MNAQGMFVRRQPVLLSPLWYVFEEAPEDLARYFPKLAQPTAAASQPEALPGPAASVSMSNGSVAQPNDTFQLARLLHSRDQSQVQTAASVSRMTRQQQCHQQYQSAECQAAADVLPDLGAPSAEASGRTDEAGPDGDGGAEAPQARRVMGPAMPAAEVLAAAAELAEEVCSFPPGM